MPTGSKLTALFPFNTFTAGSFKCNSPFAKPSLWAIHFFTLDPTKEITAEILAIGEGITTREQATIRLNGGQWDANVDQLTRENEKLRAAQGQVDQSTAASGTISAALREAIVAEAIKSIKEGDKHENA